MKIKSIILLLLLASASVAFTQKKSYVGYKHKGVNKGQTLPNGVKHLGGGLLSDDDYGVLRYSKGGKYMLWLEKVTSRNTRGIPSWVVKDVLIFDNPKKNQEFLFSYTSGCTQNGGINLDIIVKVQFLPKTKTYKVLDAWKANIRRERFEKISTGGIKCEYSAQ